MQMRGTSSGESMEIKHMIQMGNAPDQGKLLLVFYLISLMVAADTALPFCDA